MRRNAVAPAHAHDAAPHGRLPTRLPAVSSGMSLAASEKQLLLLVQSRWVPPHGSPPASEPVRVPTTVQLCAWMDPHCIPAPAALICAHCVSPPAVPCHTHIPTQRTTCGSCVLVPVTACRGGESSAGAAAAGDSAAAAAGTAGSSAGVGSGFSPLKPKKQQDDGERWAGGPAPAATACTRQSSSAIQRERGGGGVRTAVLYNAGPPLGVPLPSAATPHHTTPCKHG